MARMQLKSATNNETEELVLIEAQDSEDFMRAVEGQIKDAEPSSEDIEKDALTSPLARIVRERFDEILAQRNELENTWLKDLRQYRGVYSPDVLDKMHPKRSKAFIRLTRTKVKTVDSRLSDFLFPATGEKNWNIEPTPIAEYSQEQIMELYQAHVQQTGQEPTTAQLQLLIDSSAKERAKRMATQIEDQLADLRYRDVMKEVIHNGNLYGTGVLKGPMVNIKQEATYTQSMEDGSWMLQEFDNLTPFIEPVSIWDLSLIHISEPTRPY